MKKTTLFLAIIFCAAFSANAQFDKLRVGLKGGLNLSNVNSDIESDSRIGYHGGGFARVRWEKMGLQADILWSTQGYDIENGTNTFLTGSREVKTNYFNVPIVAKFYLADGLNLHLGPQVGILVGGEVSTNDGNGNTNTERLEDQFEGVDIGLVLGAGYELPGGLGISARYNLGLTDFSDDQTFVADNSVKNRVLQVSLSYALLRSK